MKKFLSLILCLVLLFTLAACGSKTEPADEPVPSEDSTEPADLLAEIRERGYIVIGTEGDWSPWTYTDESDNLTGFDVEVGALIAEGLGVEAQFVTAAWDSLLAGLDSKRFDLVCNGVGWTEERAEKYSFSTPYVYTHSVLVVRGDDDTISSFEDLNGKTTANTASSTYASLAEEYGATVTPVDSLEETITLLLQERIDATINSQVTIVDYLAQHPDANLTIGARTEGKPVVYPVRKAEDTDTLVAAIDEVLQELRDNGKLAELSIKYFGVDITKESSAG